MHFFHKLCYMYNDGHLRKIKISRRLKKNCENDFLLKM